MPRKRTTDQNTTQAQPEGLRVEKYGNTRNFALYDGEELLGVFVYKRGAEAIRQRLERYEAVIAEKTQIIAAMAYALTEHQNTHAATPEPQTPEPTSRRETPGFRERVALHRPPQQMSLLAADDKSAYRHTNPRDSGPKQGR